MALQPTLSFATKLINRLIGERDWSAQEVCHLLLEIPLTRSSRQVITFDCRPEEQQAVMLELDENGDEQPSGKSILQKYRERLPTYESTTLLAFLTTFEHMAKKDHRPRPRAKPRVIVYQPQYKSQPDHPDYEDFCRTKIALHHPWRTYPALPWNSCLTWASAYQHCLTICDSHSPDWLEPREPEPMPEEQFEPGLPPQPDERDANVMLAGETANRNPAARHEDPDHLGDRTDDWRYDWSAHVNTYRLDEPNPDGMPDIHAGSTWWKCAKELYPARAEVPLQSQAVIEALAPEQRLIYDSVMKHCQRALRGEVDPPLLFNIDGRAGTGKSFVIKVLSAHLQELCPGRDVLLRCAPTGAAAFGINGSTIHSLLRLPIQKKIEPMAAGPLQSLQARLADTRYLIIDEKSMISPKTLYHTNYRLQEAFANTVDFGGMSILLFGDFWQLPPVLEHPLYLQLAIDAAPISSQSAVANNKNEIEEDAAANVASPDAALARGHTFEDQWGVHLYRLFRRSIEMTVQQRQDPTQEKFAAALEGLRGASVTRAHWETLTSRCQVRYSFSMWARRFEKEFHDLQGPGQSLSAGDLYLRRCNSHVPDERFGEELQSHVPAGEQFAGLQGRRPP